MFGLPGTPSLLSRGRTVRPYEWIAWAIGVIAGVALILKALRGAAVAVDPYWPPYADGAFQLLNPLRRLLAGGSLGGEYVVFYGPGWHLPFVPGFLLGGQDLAAGEITRQVVGTFAFPLALGFLLWLILRSPRRTATVMGPLIAVILVVLPELTETGNGVPGIRASAAILVAVAVLTWVRARQPDAGSGGGGRWTGPLVAAGVAGLLAADQLVVFVVSACLLIFLPAVWQKRWRDARAGLTFMLGGCASFVIGVAILAHGSPTGTVTALRYSLVDVPADQIWFFGSWPNQYIRSWAELFLDHAAFVVVIAVASVLAVAAIVKVLKRAAGRPPGPPEATAVAASAGVLAIAAFVVSSSYLGYTGKHYLTIAVGLELVAGVVLGLSALPNSGRTLGHRPSRYVRWVWAGAAAAVLVAVPSTLARVLPFNLVPGYRGWLVTGQVLTDECRGGQPTWSTYSTLLEATAGCFNPSTDYIIHAVGSQRQQYLRAFRDSDPAVVQTLRGDIFKYEAWLRDNYADLYLRLYRHYEPVASSTHSVFWRRLSGASPVRECGTNTGTAFVPIVAPHPPPCQLAAVTVRYGLSGVGVHIPLLNRLSRAAITVEGSRVTSETIAVNPRGSVARFPVIPADPRTGFRLIPSVDGLAPGVSLEISAIEVEWLTTPSRSLWKDVFTTWWTSPAVN